MQNKLFRNFLLVFLLLICFLILNHSVDKTPPSSECTSMGNPAYTYCTEIMGYDYEVVTELDGAQDGFCKMPDGLVCPQWDFYSGKCGQEYSYCVQNGASLELRNDGKDPFSREYSICIDKKGQELGTFWDLSGFRLVTTGFDKDLFPLENDEDLDSSLPPVRDIPSSFDWRNYGGIDWMTSVKNQLSCGSCWAFSSIGLAEAQNNIISSNPDIDLDLSEQYLVSDCCDCGDCEGGIEPFALYYIRDFGVPDEACYPYISADSLCSAKCADYDSRLKFVPNAHAAFNFSEPYEYTEENIKSIISFYGPVTFGIGISTPSGSYWDGEILRCKHDIPSDGTNYMDHAVLGVGYDDAGGYWIVKNSWGTGFGEDGYFKLGYNECNVAHTRISWVESELPNTNQAPIANAGPDQVVTTTSLVTLNGSGSYDPDGNTPITYKWTQTAGTSVTLSSLTAANPTFTSPEAPGLLTFSLVVTDSLGLASAPDSVNIFNGIEPFFELYLPLVMKGGFTDPIINGGFELGHVGWSEYTKNNYFQPIVTQAFVQNYNPGVSAHNGTWLVWLGGSYNEINSISQTITIPASGPYLHYWYWIGSADACGYDFFRVKLGTTSVHTKNLCQTTNTGGWVQGVLNLAAYAGSPVSLKFEVTTDDILNSNLFLDDIFFSTSSTAAPDVMLPDGVDSDLVSKPHTP